MTGDDGHPLLSEGNLPVGCWVVLQSAVCFHELNEALRHAEFSRHVPSRSRPSQSNVKCIFKVDKVVKRSLLVLKMILHQDATIGNLFRHSCWMSASPSCQQSPLWTVVCWTLLDVAFSLQITIIKRIATQQKNYTKQTSNQSADCHEQRNQSIVRLHSTKQPIKTKETNIGEGAGLVTILRRLRNPSLVRVKQGPVWM